MEERDAPVPASVDRSRPGGGREAIAELRARAGIHPASLTESGLPGALRGLAFRCPIDVAVDLAERLPESVEIAFYYVAAEALANVAKYARAERVELSSASRTIEAILDVATTGSAARRSSGAVSPVWATASRRSKGGWS